MRVHLCRTIAAAAFVVLSGAAFADVTVSQSNDPTVLIGEQFASLFGAEHAAVNAMPEAQMSALVNGKTTTTRLWTRLPRQRWRSCSSCGLEDAGRVEQPFAVGAFGEADEPAE